MVPLNDDYLVLDLIKELNLPVIIISKHYLGSINHTLLTINTLKQNRIPIKGIIFNGDENQESEKYILNYGKVNHLGNIPTLKMLDKENIVEAGKRLKI